MDAFPGYTMFDNTKKVLCVIQIVEDNDLAETTYKTVMPHADEETIYAYDSDNDGADDEEYSDSVAEG